jgi:phage terminase small subunit
VTLNPREQRFADEYALDPNATQAAKNAGYSERTAYSIGSRLLKKAEIQDAIRARKAQQDAEYEFRVMQKYEVLARLTEIARSDIGDLLPDKPAEGDEEAKPGAGPKDIETWKDILEIAKSRGKSHLIRNMKTRLIPTLQPDGSMENGVETQIEMYSAHEALRDLGKHYKLFTDKLETTGADGGPVELKVVYEKKRLTTGDELGDA